MINLKNFFFGQTGGQLLDDILSRTFDEPETLDQEPLVELKKEPTETIETHSPEPEYTDVEELIEEPIDEVINEDDFVEKTFVEELDEFVEETFVEEPDEFSDEEFSEDFSEDNVFTDEDVLNQFSDEPTDSLEETELLEDPDDMFYDGFDDFEDEYFEEPDDFEDF